MDGQRYRFGPFLLDVDRTTLFRDGSPVTLGTRAFALLRVLLDAGNREVSKADLIDAAWPETAIEESNLSVQVANLRRAAWNKSARRRMDRDGGTRRIPVRR